MNDRDVLAELRAWRDEFARTHGYDLSSMATALRELDRAVGPRLIRGEARRPIASQPAQPGMPNQSLHLTGAA